MRIKDIKINKANPRIIKDERFKKLMKSISEFPKMMELRPIVVDIDGTILGGNMRYKALCELGYKEIPDTWVKRADELSDEEKQRFIIEDNVGFGEWDFEMLADTWDRDLLSDWGVDVPSFDEDIDTDRNDIAEKVEVEEDDFDEESDKIESRCSRGDIWQLGNHRLMCGDSTSDADVAKLAGGQKSIWYLQTRRMDINISRTRGCGAKNLT